MLELFDDQKTELAQKIIDFYTQYTKHSCHSKAFLKKNILGSAQKIFSDERAKIWKYLETKAPGEMSYLDQGKRDPVLPPTSGLREFICRPFISKKHGQVQVEFFRIVINEPGLPPKEYYIKYQQNTLLTAHQAALMNKSNELNKKGKKAEAEDLWMNEFTNIILSGWVFSSWTEVLSSHEKGTNCDQELYKVLIH